MTGEGADGQVVALVPDVAKVLQPIQVDQHGRRGQPEPHDWYEGVPARYKLCVLPVLLEQLYSVVDRLGDLVVEGYRYHWLLLPSCLTSASRVPNAASYSP